MSTAETRSPIHRTEIALATSSERATALVTLTLAHPCGGNAMLGRKEEEDEVTVPPNTQLQKQRCHPEKVAAGKL